MNNKKYYFADSLFSEILLSVLMGMPLIFCATGLY